MKILKILSAVAIVVSLTGCANLVLRPRAEYNQGPYYYTKFVNKEISRGIDGKLIERTFLPVLFIDWPFDALTDTILWPWDEIVYSMQLRKWKRGQR